MADRGKPLLDARRGELAYPGLDPGGDVYRLDGGDRAGKRWWVTLGFKLWRLCPLPCPHQMEILIDEPASWSRRLPGSVVISPRHAQLDVVISQ
jgi:hypothetical protein